MPKLRLGTSAKRFRWLSRLVVLSLVGAATATGCAADGAGHASPTPRAEDDRPLVLTTFTVLADMTRVVAGDEVRVESITRVDAEIHGYEPTPGDIKRATGADLILDNGLGLEAWFEQFLTHIDAPRVTLSHGIETVAIGQPNQETRTDLVAGANPHAWMSPTQARTYVDNIVTALSELRPASASAFRERGDKYQAELQEIAGTLEAAIARVPEAQRVLVTCEGAFSYLARDAGLDEAYLWPVNADYDPTARDIAAVIDLVRERDVPAVFCESTVSDRAMRQVHDATDAAWGGTLYVDSLSGADGPVPTYLELLRHDVDVMVAGLTGATG